MDNINHHRRSIRLKGYDYTQAGAYFITLCTWQRKCLFGEVVKGEMHLNQAGRIVQDAWQQLATQFQQIQLDAFCVMPNHVHGIIVISSSVGASQMDREGANTTPRNQQDDPDSPVVGATRSGHEETISAPRIQMNGSNSAPVGSPRPTQDQDRVIPPTHPKGPPSGSIGAMIGQFKSHATRRIWKLPGFEQATIWQRNYYEHILRSDHEWDQIVRYIQGNPAQWEEDQLHPEWGMK